MLQTSNGPRARHWSNVVLIFTGLLLAGFATIPFLGRMPRAAEETNV